MCDKNKYRKIFEDINKLEPEDTLQLILESDDNAEKEFFAMLGNYILQRKQKAAIERNVF